MNKILALLTCVLLVVPVVPGVIIEEVTATEIALAASAPCDYYVSINYVPGGDKCLYWAGAWAFEGSSFITATVRWEDVGLAIPAYGKACVWWYCYSNGSMPHGRVEARIPGQLYLPFVSR